jgi:hypothetical protein
LSRIIKEINIEGERVTALFDTDSERSYVVKKRVKSSYCKNIAGFGVTLDGKRHKIKQRCLYRCEIDGLPFSMSAHLIDGIGEIDGRKIDILIGATTMKEREIKVSPDERELDLTGLKKREFTEL